MKGTTRETWIALPVRSLAGAKTRLAPALDAPARRMLAEKMFRHVLGVAIAFAGASHCMVVTGDPDVARLAAQAGALVVAEGEAAGMNHAVALAAERLAALADEQPRLLVLPGDLPLLAAGELEVLVAAADAGASVVIAPDRSRSGTNALLIERPDLMRFSFGEGSFEAHRRQAEQAHLTVAIVSRPRLALDIDTPNDLLELDSFAGAPDPKAAADG